MIKKTLVFIFLFSLLLGCKETTETEFEGQSTNATKADSALVDIDKDKNGCLASAGYTWSKINKECIKVFTGLQLVPAANKKTDDQSVCAYVLFDENVEQAEVFMPSAEVSVLLKQVGNTKVWENGSLKLVRKTGFYLLKDNKILFEGDDQIGSKVSGSDDVEQSAVPEAQ